MASRTSSGVAMGVAVTILALLFVGSLLTAIYLFAQTTDLTRALSEEQARYNDVIKPGEEGAERVKLALDRVRGRQSLVSHLLEERNRLTQLAAGASDITASDVESLMAAYARSAGLAAQGDPNDEAATATAAQAAAPLLTQLKQRDASLGRLQDEVAAAQRLRDTGTQDARAAIERVDTIQASFRGAIDGSEARIDEYEDDMQRLRRQVEQFQETVAREAAATRAEHEAELAERDSQIDDLSQQVLVLRDQLARLRNDDTGVSLAGADEFALVDGEIAAVETLNNIVVISRGRADKVRLGMVFSVYSAPTDILPDRGTGEYTAGKATVEVISVGERTSRARLVNVVQGNPVIRGDVIANPLYDPNKEYRFVVFGRFDTDGDGGATILEAETLKSLIRSWGGSVQDEIQGDTDFVVLGREPELPPAPGPDAPRLQIERYLEASRRQERYRQLFEVARATSIPVLNENRLRTLLGEIPR